MSRRAGLFCRVAFAMFAAQQCVVIGGQRRRIDARLPLHERRDGVAHQRVGGRAFCTVEGGEIRGVAEVVQEVPSECMPIRRGVTTGPVDHLVAG